MRKLSALFVFTALLSCYTCAIAQVVNPGLMDTTDVHVKGKLAVEGYVDTYYSYNLNNPKNQNISYFVSSARHNEMNINLAYVALKYNAENIRARFIPAFGSFMNSNYSNEPGTLKNLLEANIGVRLSAKKNIWVDAGVLGSPYTNESPISKDHLMYTRSLAAEYTPYYLSGAKLTLPLSKKITSYFYLLNGWQLIQDRNSQKSAGTQIEFRPNKKLLVDWNTFIGDERKNLDPQFRNRFFSDIYLVAAASKKWDITSCMYYGLQQVQLTDKTYRNYNWWQANFIARYKFNSRHSLSGRVEYFSDVHQVMIQAVTGFRSAAQMGGAGLCWNIQVNENAVFRIENRFLTSEKKLFLYDGRFSQFFNWSVVNLTVWF